MPKDGRDLQRLVASLEKAKASGRTDLKIETPAYRLDKVTQRKREHDVLLTYTLNHHEVVIALECRDRSRPIGVDAVEAFHTKCENTGIHHGMIVSAKGFGQPALAKAQFYNIRCLTLDEVDRHDWCHAPGLLFTARYITHTHVNVLFPEGVSKRKGTLIMEDGTPVTREHMMKWAENILTNHHEKTSFDLGAHSQTFQMSAPPVFMRLKQERVQAVFMIIKIDYTVKSDLAPFAFRKYVDASSATAISEVAIATMPIGGEHKADFVFATGENGITVSLVPHKK